MASAGLISPLNRWTQNVVISRSNLIKWKPMKHLLPSVVECVQENFIMVRYGIMNRLVYNFREETPVFSLICICLPMQQNSW